MNFADPSWNVKSTQDPALATLLALAIDLRLPGLILDAKSSDPEPLLHTFVTWFADEHRPIPLPSHLTPTDLMRQEWSFPGEEIRRHPSFLTRSRERTLVIRRPDELDPALWSLLARRSIAEPTDDNESPIQLVIIEERNSHTPPGPYLRPLQRRRVDPVQELRKRLESSPSTPQNRIRGKIRAARGRLQKIVIEESLWPALTKIVRDLDPRSLGDGDQHLLRAVRLLRSWAAFEERFRVSEKDAEILLQLFPLREASPTEPEPSPGVIQESSSEDPESAPPSPQNPNSKELSSSATAPPETPIQAHLHLPSGTPLSRTGRGRQNPDTRNGRIIGHRAVRSGRCGSIDPTATFRRALPFQTLRGRKPESPPVLHVDDLRVAIRRKRQGELFVLVLDASGSMRGDRIQMARGAAQAILEQAYRTRASLGLVVCSAGTARLVVPPMNSPQRIQRAILSERAVGGTALGLGIQIALEQGRSRNRSPRLLLATDGRANLALDGSRDPERAAHEVRQLLTAATYTGSTPIVLGRTQDRRARDFSTHHHLPFVPVHPLDPSQAATRIESMTRLDP
ncbi:MAG: VWA domain-containing protein [Planctomycetota bacterium]|nr:VWA domain-containing protein [Planctomycetota bacterium]